MRFVAVLLTIATTTALVWLFTAGDALPLEVAIFVQILAFWARRRPILRTLHAADRPARDLDVLSHILEVLEHETFSSPRLRDLRRRLETDGGAASTAIRRLHRLMELHDWEHNAIFVPIAATLQWGTHLAWAIEAWRTRHGVHVRRWLDAVAEVEALASLAAYRYEHPGDPFPEIVDGPATFEGERLGHPLLPAARMVSNDVRLAGETRLLVVSGSNMSGKSTLLRTVGVNAVLAFAGAPVRAAELRVTPLAIGATLRIQDSLQEGRSRFYAEITRIRRLSDAARGTPHLLFLLDELFHGTNSHDRLIGASGVLRRLVERGAIGLVTTHDLAMTRVVDELAPRCRQRPFRRLVRGGRAAIRLSREAGAGDAEQRDCVDACSRTRRRRFRRAVVTASASASYGRRLRGLHGLVMSRRYSKCDMTMTSDPDVPRVTASVLPSRDHAKLPMIKLSNDVTCRGVPPVKGISQTFADAPRANTY